MDRKDKTKTAPTVIHRTQTLNDTQSQNILFSKIELYHIMLFLLKKKNLDIMLQLQHNKHSGSSQPGWEAYQKSPITLMVFRNLG